MMYVARLQNGRNVSSMTMHGLGFAAGPRRRRPLRYTLGLEPDSYYANLVLPSSKISGKPGFDRASQDYILQAVAAGVLPTYPENCAQITGSQTGNILSASGGLATKAGSAFAAGSGVAATAASIALPIVGGVLALFGALWGHHAAAVQREQETLCGAIPAASESLRIIESEFRAGNLTVDQARASLDRLYNDFSSAVSTIIKDTSDKCNYACGARRALKAVIEKKKQQYLEAGEQKTGVAALVENSKGWLPWVAGGLLAYQLVAA